MNHYSGHSADRSVVEVAVKMMSKPAGSTNWFRWRFTGGDGPKHVDAYYSGSHATTNKQQVAKMVVDFAFPRCSLIKANGYQNRKGPRTSNSCPYRLIRVTAPCRKPSCTAIVSRSGLDCFAIIFNPIATSRFAGLDIDCRSGMQWRG